MTVLKQIREHRVIFGGESYSGWLPKAAATPLPTPTRDVILNVEICSEGNGYLLCWASQDDELWGDSWHRTLEDAEQAAIEDFGVRPDQWQTLV